jgi:DNA-binding beta-propeller fold protein YncE
MEVLYPNPIAVDSRNNIYISSYGGRRHDSHKILKISIADSGDIQVSDFAGQDHPGKLEGNGTAAMFAAPTNIVCHNDTLYVVDSWNHRIRTITSDGTVSTFAEGYGYRFDSISCFAVDPRGNLFVGDKDGRIIRQFEPTNGDDTTFARTPQMLDEIAVDKDGNVYGTKDNHSCIYKITSQSEEATIFAGSIYEKGYKDGTGIEARFENPRGLAIDKDGNVFVADMSNSCIRKITPAGVVTTVEAEPDSQSKLEFPMYIAINNTGTLYISQGQHGDLEIITIKRLELLEKARGVRNAELVGLRTGMPHAIEGLIAENLTGIRKMNIKQQKYKIKRQLGIQGPELPTTQFSGGKKSRKTKKRTTYRKKRRTTRRR